MYDNRPIGVFDSGIGGLTVLLEIKKLLPNESFVYLADQENLPFGIKNQGEIRAIAERALKFLASKNVKTIVVACNTATVYAIDYLRSRFELPIIGVVPVVRTIVENTKTGKTLVFSTPATAKSHYLKELVRKFSDGKKVYIIGGSNLEGLIEQGKVDDPLIDKILDDNLMPLIRKGVDSIALSCTHYPFVKEKIEAKVGSKVQVYDSGPAVARRVKQVLSNEELLGSSLRFGEAGRRVRNEFYTSTNPKRFKLIAEKLSGEKLAWVGKAII